MISLVSEPVFVMLAEDLEDRAGCEWHIAEFVDDKQFDGGELLLDFERSKVLRPSASRAKVRKMQGKAAARTGKSDLSLVRPSAPRCCTSRQNPLHALRQVRLILFEERRQARTRRADGEPRLDAHNAALRPPRRRGNVRRG